MIERRRSFARGNAGAHELRIDSGIDHQMSDMNMLRPQLTRHRLGESAHSKFVAGERGVADTAAQSGGGSGKEDRAFFAWHHDPGRLAPGEKSRPAGHFPHLAKYPVGGLQNREVDVRTDIADANLERREVIRLLQERRDVVRNSRIEGAPERTAAGRIDLGDEGRKFFAIAPSGEYCKSLGREFPGDGSTNVVTGADDCDRCAVLLHALREPLHFRNYASPAL